MKRHLVWLTLPFVLLALSLGVKWRADHPTPTKEDLEIRALMSENSFIEVSHSIWKGKKLNEHRMKLSRIDFQPFVDSFYISPNKSSVNLIAMPKGGLITIKPREDGKSFLVITLNFDKKGGMLLTGSLSKTAMKTIHPVTAKRWIELLLSNPRIGPELRARLK